MIKNRILSLNYQVAGDWQTYFLIGVILIPPVSFCFKNFCRSAFLGRMLNCLLEKWRKIVVMEFPWASQPMNLFVILGMANMQARNDEMLFFPFLLDRWKESSFAHIPMHAEMRSYKSDILQSCRLQKVVCSLAKLIIIVKRGELFCKRKPVLQK